MAATAAESKAVRRPRAARVASPKAPRIKLTGVMLAPDKFDRVRILLVDKDRAGRADRSWATLRKAVPPAADDWGLPYKMREQADADGVWGEFWAVIPARHRKLWLPMAVDLRGKEVVAELTIRRYSLRRRVAVNDAEADALQSAPQGVALDLAALSPASAAPAPASSPAK
jgi:hypothetical protein